ncbi:MAG: hypothetical protein ABFQ65_00075 [Nanoarchaeota archaeon]
MNKEKNPNWVNTLTDLIKNKEKEKKKQQTTSLSNNLNDTTKTTNTS